MRSQNKDENFDMASGPDNLLKYIDEICDEESEAPALSCV